MSKTKISSLYHQHRQINGNHINWQNKQNGSQQQQDERVKSLANRPGLHSGNVRRHNLAQALVQLVAILNATQISSARHAAISKISDEFSNGNTTYTNVTNANTSKTERSASFHSLQHPVDAEGNSSSFMVYSGPLYSSTSESDSKALNTHPANIKANNYTNTGKTLSRSRQKRSLLGSANIPYEIMAVINAERFDYDLRNQLNKIYISALSSPEVRYAKNEDKNLYILLKCIQQ